MDLHFHIVIFFIVLFFTRHVVAMGAMEENRRHTKAKDYVLEWYFYLWTICFVCQSAGAFCGLLRID